ncbi:MAG: hypothetical protein HYY84_14815 [Deltaproteobacteria bacterium]|nr:hypothetical protein [Deltaproteobacteria bacterium]
MTIRVLGAVGLVGLVVSMGGVASARQFVDDEAGFTINVPYTYRALTKNLPKGERFWEWESIVAEKGGDRTTGNQRAIVRVDLTPDADPLKLLVAYERGGMKDRMPTFKVLTAPKVVPGKRGTRVAIATYEGLRPLDGAHQYRFVFRVSVEIVKGRAYFKILEVRAAGVPEGVVAKRVSEVQAILDTVVIR